MERKYLTVTALNRYLKHKFDQDAQLQHILIKGEISNFKEHASGHLYFTLKDEDSRINVVMFASKASKLLFKIENGMKVLIEGSVSVYEVSGNYQLYVDKMEQDGIGNLFLQFEKLKNDLSKEGLFDSNHKKQIPAFPMKIAVLSAYPSAALMDIMRTIKLRFPISRVIIFPIPVQGKDAYKMIISVLSKVDTLHFDTIILARGGGSLEDLWNFNEEALVRCIYQCNTPIISGIGHEIDVTLCDYVADYRAATPTAAASKATPDLLELKQNVSKFTYDLEHVMKQNIIWHKNQLKQCKNFYLFVNPNKLYEERKLQLDHLDHRLRLSLKQKQDRAKNEYHILSQKIAHQIKIHVINQRYQLNSQKDRLVQLIKEKSRHHQEYFYFQLSKLNTLSPIKTLERGYAIILKKQEVVDSSKKLKTGDEIEIKFKDGTKQAKIK